MKEPRVFQVLIKFQFILLSFTKTGISRNAFFDMVLTSCSNIH